MSSEVPRVKLGSEGLEVSQQGLGCMSMTPIYGPGKPEEEMIDLVHQAVESGITFLDTADIYGANANELLVGKVHPTFMNVTFQIRSLRVFFLVSSNLWKTSR